VTGPDVPSDGLLTQGGASDDAPTAVAALAIHVPDGAEVQTLTIHATSSLAVTPGSVVKACPLRSADFAPAQGGPLSQAPSYECTKAVVASAGADGVTYSFAATRLIANGMVAVALVPGSPATRVVLANPGDDVLGVTRHETPEPPIAPTVASYERAGTPATSTFAVLAFAVLLAGAGYTWRGSAPRSALRSGADA
jgi:hypothetical protein